MSICQSITKSLSGTFCLGIIFSDVSALSGIFMGFGYVQSAEVVDPIVNALLGPLLLSITIFDVITQAAGLVFAICLEWKWILRIYMVLTVTFFVIKCSTVIKDPVYNVKTAPFLGRTWTPSKTLYDQMEQDVERFAIRLPSQKRGSALYHFEKTLQCCGAKGPSDYHLIKSDACYPGLPPPPPPEGGDNSTSPAGNGSEPRAGGQHRIMVQVDEPEFPENRETLTPHPHHRPYHGEIPQQKTSLRPHPGGRPYHGEPVPVPDYHQGLTAGTDIGLAANSKPYKTGCIPKVTGVFEGERIAFDATCTGIFWTFWTIFLTIAWCEFWGDGLLTGLSCGKKNKK